LGADVVIHSATKYLAGHSDVNAGLVVVSGEDLASRVYFAQNRLGGVLAPAECDAVRRGIQTLALRMDRQQENANAIARYLLVHPLYQKCGVGSRLLELCKRRYAGYLNVVLTSYREGVPFYERNGFIPDRTQEAMRFIPPSCGETGL
jgi:O-acetylhomoserine/O-acetylserine sulfhydrylase-like pyridoxal-dependent enzyme